MRPWHAPNPQPGEIWEHHDGGSIYVTGRDKSRVCIQRRPFGDSLAEPWWIRLRTFLDKMQAGKLMDSRKGKVMTEKSMRPRNGRPGTAERKKRDIPQNHFCLDQGATAT